MTENETKLEQCRKDKAAIEALEKEIEALEKELEQAVQKEKNLKEPKWVAAICKDRSLSTSRHGDEHRLILNLAQLPNYLRSLIADSQIKWISICKDGSLGTSRLIDDGLIFYGDTKIVF